MTMNLMKISVFIIIAVALIWGGAQYNRKMDEEKAAKLEAAQKVAVEAAQNALKNLMKEDVVVGTGREAMEGDTVSVHYTGTFTDGTKFDSSLDRGMPFEFKLGAGEVIRGWDLGVAGMKVGGTRNLTIPPELGYGDRQTGPIPANSTLKFTVELLDVK